VIRCRYVAGTNDVMHRSKGADATTTTATDGPAAEDSGRRSAKFQEFLAKWKTEHVGESEEEAYTKWVSLGEAAGGASDGAANAPANGEAAANGDAMEVTA
jgi:hypothetical protein